MEVKQSATFASEIIHKYNKNDKDGNKTSTSKKGL